MRVTQNVKMWSGCGQSTSSAAMQLFDAAHMNSYTLTAYSNYVPIPYPL